MEGGWKTPLPRVSSRAKSPGLIRLKELEQTAVFSLWKTIGEGVIATCYAYVHTVILISNT